MTDARLAASIVEEAGRMLVGIRHLGGREGDRRSNELILVRLAEARPGDAVLSEEAADSPDRLSASRVWIVDPLDGTREYAMAGRTDWAVHVALWEAGAIAAAAVALPAVGTVYATDHPFVPHRPPGSSPLILVSDSRPPRFTAAVAEVVGAEVAPMGSAGAKAMAVLRGEADAYLHAGGQWEWDSAAPVGVLLSAGFHCSRLDGSPLLYNQDPPYLPDLLMCRSELAPRLLDALALVAEE
ncbi:MAG: 3'(2'),5'-bisphosphate nucleotidase CysQ [Acidimicrobiales bacterium]|nr:3'(2'),5'-bisphosphate nucleotidase CysQ [Acidimicrobiales bacterium]